MNLHNLVKTNQPPKAHQLALSAKLLALSALLFVMTTVISLVTKHWAMGFMYGGLAILESSLSFVFHTLSRKADSGKA